ncbi:MAG: putative 4-alpha-glucanotransferase, partial [Gammaproteobacteria bacterium]|nr:putative 4-alpha-glucanotransferase [Gammaproteobacteria bacterium]
MDTTLIERLARLRGIGDAYHDYRGDLRYFSLKTKTDILRAMGCAVEDPAALAAELREMEASRFRLLLPSITAAHGTRAGVELNVPAREFGGSLLWTVNLEDGGRLDGVASTAACQETWRGEVEGCWITRRRLELPVDLPPGYHELEVKLANIVSRCSLVMA